ncbi:MAG: matrixin family metalloprotease [Pleurocapsa sp.]
MRWWKRIVLTIAVLILMIISSKIVQSEEHPTRLLNDNFRQDFTILEKLNSLSDIISQSPSDSLPALKIHPLPKSLATWNDRTNRGDYFDHIESTPVGYLVWSQFPLKIYLEKPNNTDNDTASIRRWQQWVQSVRQAIAEWNVYLPLTEIEDRTIADIIIERSQIDRDVQLNPDTGLYDIPRAIAAQATYDFYLQPEHSTLAHRMTIKINPASVGRSLLATVRHELGHALGIWGHSPYETDALYYSQVREPPPISQRDINTLKKIYQQPTRLGWTVRASDPSPLLSGI